MIHLASATSLAYVYYVAAQLVILLIRTENALAASFHLYRASTEVVVSDVLMGQRDSSSISGLCNVG